jgi:hypothetical protein
VNELREPAVADEAYGGSRRTQCSDFRLHFTLEVDRIKDIHRFAPLANGIIGLPARIGMTLQACAS